MCLSSLPQSAFAPEPQVEGTYRVLNGQPDGLTFDQETAAHPDHFQKFTLPVRSHGYALTPLPIENFDLSFSETRSDSARPEGRPVFPIQHTQPAGS
jgi:hypothetical protein